MENKLIKQQLQNDANPKDVFDCVYDFRDGFARVRLGEKWNFIDRNDNLLSENLWFDEVYYFSDGFALVKLNGKWYEIDTNGNLYDLHGNPINNITENRRRVLRMIKIKCCTRTY